jgi:hypothetical protein
MKISTQLEVLRVALDAWASPLGGTAVAVPNLKELWNQASMSSQKPRLLICYMGEKIRGPFADASVAGRVDRQWTVAITRGRGFASMRGDTLKQQVGNVEAFADSVEACRDLIRNLEGVSQEWPMEYKSIKPMQLGNLVVDGYLIEFSTANDLDKLTTVGN